MAVSPTRVPLSPSSPKKAAAEAWAETYRAASPRARIERRAEAPLGVGTPPSLGRVSLFSSHSKPAVPRTRRVCRVAYVTQLDELGVETDALGGGRVVVEGGADGGDGVRARVGEEARKPAHRVQLVDGEVDLPLADKEQVGGAGGRGEQDEDREDDEQATAHAASGKIGHRGRYGELLFDANHRFHFQGEPVNNLFIIHPYAP